MVEIFGLTVRDVTNVSLRFQDGEQTALLGGRSDGPETLAQVLSGALHAEPGCVTVTAGGAEFTGAALRRRTFRTLTPPVFPAGLHLWDVLMLTAFSYGMSRRKADLRCERALEALQMEDVESIPPAKMPLDWQVRTCLAQALVPESAILLLDRPFAGLPPETAAYFARVVRKYAENSVFWLLDSPLDAEILNGRNVVFASGSVLFDGSCDEACSRFGCARFAQAFERMRVKAKV